MQPILDAVLSPGRRLAPPAASASRFWVIGSQRCAGPLNAAISQLFSWPKARTAARAPSISAALDVRRLENSVVPSEGFSSRVVAENCASKLSKEPVRREDTSRVRFSARMEDWGLARASPIQYKDVTASSQFESSKLRRPVALTSNRKSRKLRRVPAIQTAIETNR